MLVLLLHFENKCRSPKFRLSSHVRSCESLPKRKRKTTRRTSIPLSRESTKRRKQCVNHGQYKSTRLMTPHSDESEEETNNCVNCDAQRSTNNERDQQVEHTGRKSSNGNMAFPALSVMGGGGQIVRSRSKISINAPEDEQRSPYRNSINLKNKETVILNVGGQIFETYKNTLTRLKSCKLARESELKRHYRESKGDYFFDRDPQLFSVILNYLRTNELHLPTYLCGPAVQREFDYWGIDEEDIERCCWQPYNTWKTQNKSLEKLEYDRKRSMTQQHLEKDRRSPHFWTRCKATVWNFLQNPNTSLGAKIYAWISIIFVFLSIFSFCAETHPLFRVSKHEEFLKDFGTLYDLFTFSTIQEARNHTETLSNTTTANPMVPKNETVVHPALIITDLLCVSFFTLEFLTRFMFCPRKYQFITALQNIIDFIAILPDYIEFFLKLSNPQGNDWPFMDFIFILRMLRLCRIFRLIRHVPGLWILLYTLKASFNELLLMFVFLLIGMVIFASLIHFAEPDSGYDNIPIGFWWSVITMTTVGYGDMNPTSAPGYVIGSLCAISGLLMIAFTVPIIVSNFVLYYTHVQYGCIRHGREKSKLMDTHDLTEEDNDGESLKVIQCQLDDIKQTTVDENKHSELTENGQPRGTDGNCNNLG
ncbi:potassium voltage-gated channel protein Shaw-like isoform X2 [Ostrea edulis]|uniref:potassium voltage-gated channel protein Shaw-like isoform X2 n=1 Tax=Ostrea edulis TaxID=37623 RepID=UPI0024AEFB01|nr:potassium voltage-gated channel protein Shaw-like isoform X2 [Ostrea edulis]